ncbi:hypothetical protein BJX63DRAFT_444105 [Aspergillus granulosus]|uniref:Zn(2)-C6 fungal-type domain-containing protein n=1 Tax=Aspergillus granulosus TaxID=176169 RepID=A0ABR4H9H3_9EURO
MVETEQTCTVRNKKKFTRRARTGCQTCKIRRIKCDESPGSCLNCTSTGRKCDGYDMTRLPRRRNQLGLMVARYLCVDLPGKSSDERRCFNLFQSRTIPMFVSLFESDLWRVVLQMSQEDPSVCHAVVALSALHQETLICRPSRSPKSLHLHWDFAGKQYGRALGLLARRLESNDPYMRYTALCLRDNYSGALVHLQNGVNVLTNEKGQTARAFIISGAIHPSGSHSSNFDVALARTFAHLDVQSAHFDPASCAINFYPGNGNLVDLDYCHASFDTLNGAKETLDPLLNNVFHIWRVTQPVLRNQHEERDISYYNLLAEQHRMRTYLSQHITAFNQFLARYSPNTSKEARSLDVIRLHHIILYLNIETCLSLSEMVFDNYLPEWAEATNLADRIIKSSIAEFGSGLPNLVIDTGVTLPLSWIALKCRDFTLRQRAIDLLRLWPHSEGLHNTAVLMNLGQEVFAIERKGIDPVTLIIPETSRVRTVNMEIDKDRRKAKLVYSLSDPAKDHPVVREQLFCFEQRVPKTKPKAFGLRTKPNQGSRSPSSSYSSL